MSKVPQKPRKRKDRRNSPLAPGRHPAAGASRRESAPLELSGPQWVERFPNSVELAALASPFKEHVSAFHQALLSAGAVVTIAATRRPAERAFLMHYAYEVANGSLAPKKVPRHPNIPIRWVHATLTESRAAAQEMVTQYEIAHEPSLHSKHIEGRAIDMTITWVDKLEIADKKGRVVAISSEPASGENSWLHEVGATYGVVKLPSDPPHWSDNGH